MDKTKAAVALFNKCASMYQDKFMDVDLYAATFDLFCSSIPKKGAHILELACGPGNITKYLLEKRPDLKILGTDLAPNMLDLALANNPGAEFQLMDCRDIGTISKKYEAVMCGFCLPYLSREEAVKLIKDASGLLEKDGILYLSTMEGGYNTSGPRSSSSGDVIYMYYHQSDYLVQALQENGFRIIALTRQDYPSGDGIKTTDLIIIAGK